MDWPLANSACGDAITDHSLLAGALRLYRVGEQWRPNRGAPRHWRGRRLSVRPLEVRGGACATGVEPRTARFNGFGMTTAARQHGRPWRPRLVGSVRTSCGAFSRTRATCRCQWSRARRSSTAGSAGRRRRVRLAISMAKVEVGAVKRTRTSTPVKELAPQASASTSSAMTARFRFNPAGAKRRRSSNKSLPRRQA